MKGQGQDFEQYFRPKPAGYKNDGRIKIRPVFKICFHLIQKRNQNALNFTSSGGFGKGGGLQKMGFEEWAQDLKINSG